MFKKIIKLFKPKNNHKESCGENLNENVNRTIYSVQNLPFLFNYEYFNIAWGRKHKGYYIDPLGNVLDYNLPENWNFYTSSNKNSSQFFWGHEIDGRISPEALFQNLNNVIERNRNSNIVNIKLVEILQDITEAGFEETGCGCDMGIESYVILIYDNTIDQYRRIILKTNGDVGLTNKSIYTVKLLKYLDQHKTSI